MTWAVTLYQRRLFVPDIGAYAVSVLERFTVINRRGVITIGLGSVIALSVAAYLVSMYYFFAVGMALRSRTEMLRDLDNSNVALELRIQTKETGFALEHKDVLESMQKISSIKYLAPANMAVSQRNTNTTYTP